MLVNTNLLKQTPNRDQILLLSILYQWQALIPKGCLHVTEIRYWPKCNCFYFTADVCANVPVLRPHRTASAAPATYFCWTCSAPVPVPPNLPQLLDQTVTDCIWLLWKLPSTSAPAFFNCDSKKGPKPPKMKCLSRYYPTLEQAGLWQHHQYTYHYFHYWKYKGK